ncbi:MAG: hypothetical protein M1366_02710 [Patescibacteria group bacterium]|nr:hypothetical protein [Patescibacteria group bacterium]
MTQNISKSRTTTKILIFLLFAVGVLFFPKNVNAQYVSYPVKELGNCQNQNECRLYCDIPAHTPACWSYNKYILNKNVLGDTTTNISYPIKELGNCADAQTCFIYCSQAANQEACLTYAQQNGLTKQSSNTNPTDTTTILNTAKTELGCSSKTACINLCSQEANHDKCEKFARKYGLNSDNGESNQVNSSPYVLNAAKTELGCSDQNSCMLLCSTPENSDKCLAFAQKYNLISKALQEKITETQQKRAEMLQEAKTELGCDSESSCMDFCSLPNNHSQCFSLAQKVGLIPQQEMEGNQAQSGFAKTMQQTSVKNCTDEKQCQQYCTIHPDQCPGYNSESDNSTPSGNEQNHQVNPLQTQNKPATGSYLGPAGCRTEKECQDYCQNHPDQCPGFPQKSPQPQQNSDNGNLPAISPTSIPLPTLEPTHSPETQSDNIISPNPGQ